MCRYKLLVLALAGGMACLGQPGFISTVAGTGVGGFSGDNGPATAARVNNPDGVFVDDSGNIYIADYLNYRVRKIDGSGTIRTVASCGSFSLNCQLPVNLGDGSPATSVSISPMWDVVADKSGNFYFSDSGTNRIRKVSASGILSTYAGDGGLATSARLNAPHGVGVDAAGNIYIADTTNYRIRKINPAGIISTVAGNGEVITVLPSGTIRGNGDGSAATAANVVPWDVKPDSNGNLYISDWLNHRIRKVDGSGIITTIAGNGTVGSTGDGGLGTNALINNPTGVAVDAGGNVYFAEFQGNRIRKVNAPPLGPPTIRTTNTVVPAFMGNAGFSSNMYVEIYGTNFSNVSRVWAGSDFSGANAPTSLEGVSVRINGKLAYVYYVSPGQINVNVPEDTATGSVSIQVITSAGTSNTINAQRSRLSPAMLTTPAFNIGGKQFVAALTPNFASFIGRPNMIAGVSFVTPRPGDTVSIYALGAGPTNPPTQAGVTASQNAVLASPYQVKIGGVPATVSFAGLLAGTIGLYQLNVVIPPVGAADQTIEFIVDGVSNNQSLYITVGP